ncbi:hypothetical protein SAMN05444003_0047 [Cognatiyoonia sediminum]|uniref:Tetratricopeptide repeat-containing protein n=1 Tax=Cognatiyoonia sediminum TaxID=1508389 RepID=A0A1M5L2E8_9RHOB|nr:hypothetical protein SAMN05444003_0047 [Cognatiyoonia sediminum]
MDRSVTTRSLISTLKGIGAALFFACGQVASAETTLDLTFPQARQLAFNLLVDGNAAAALEVADGLITANANDQRAWIIRAGALRVLEQPSLARQAARRAYWLAESPARRYEAARLAASANADEERFSWAQFWLRLARENAPDEETANRVAQDYQALRRINPWSFNASFGVAPSANINGGSQADVGYLDDNVDEGLAAFLAFFGIYDPESGLRLLGDNERALSGIEANLDFGAQYRLNATENSATFISADVGIRRYRLSDEAKEQSPTSSNRDFNRDSLSFGIRHLTRLGEDLRPATFALSIGKNWYASEQSNRYMAVNASQPFLLDPQNLLTFGISASASASYSDDIPVRTFGANAQLLSILESGDRVRSNFQILRSNSDIEDSDYVSLSAGVSYIFAQPILGTFVTINSDAVFSDIGDTRFAPFDREDITVSIGADVAAPQAEVFGFQPVVSVLAERTRSSVDQFDAEGVSVGLDFRSSF